MTTAIGYARVSTVDQATEGYSLDHQREVIEAEVKRRGWHLDGLFIDDGYTGSNLDRPALSEALTALREGDAEVLIVTRLDRLSRSVIDFSRLLERANAEGWSVVALDLGVDTTTPTGDLMVNLMASFAQFERRQIRERCIAGVRSKAKRGKGWVTGRPPYGYRVIDGELVPEPQEALVVEFIFARAARGMTNCRIRNRLNREEVPSPTGDEWTTQTIRKVLRNPVYSGRYLSLGRYPVEVTPLVTRRTWLKVQRLTEERRAKRQQRKEASNGSANAAHRDG